MAAVSERSVNRLAAARWAVCAVFFVNGFAIGSWASKVPVMVQRLDIDAVTFGQMIIVFGVGAVIALGLAAVSVVRFGSARVLRWSALCLIPSLTFLTVMPGVVSTALAMLWFGMFLGAMDNAMNAHGVEVEVELDRPVMSSYHGFWSLGGVAGALSGGALIVWLGELGHALWVGALSAVLVLWSAPRFLDDRAASGRERADRSIARIPRQLGIYGVGVIAMLAFAAEGAIIDWGALYLKNELFAPLIVSGYAFAAFSMTMALMRLCGDLLRARFGDRMVFLVSGAVSASGLLLAGLADDVLSACGGFMIAGLGMANTVPVLFSAAGRFPGIEPSIGIAILSLLGYSGLLFIPALVGFVAERWTLSLVFALFALIVAGITASAVFLPGFGPWRSPAR